MGNCACARSSKGSQFETKLAKCRMNESVFNDIDFPPTNESLIPDWGDDDPDVQAKVAEWALFEWKRVSDIFDKN